MKFPCTKCGICCQHISGIKELKKFDLGNGICKYYDKKKHICKIYDRRPDICNIDKMYELVYYKQHTKKEFYIMNAKVCNQLQEIFNINPQYRVKIGG